MTCIIIHFKFKATDSLTRKTTVHMFLKCDKKKSNVTKKNRKKMYRYKLQ